MTLSSNLRPKEVLRLLKSRALHSAPKPPPSNQKPPNTIAAVLDFTDSKELFSSVSTGKLLKSLTILKASSIPVVSGVGSFVFNSKLHEKALLRPVVLGFTEHTFYDHFCAGKDIEEATATAAKLWHSRISSMLDYALEGANDNESCDRNTEVFINTIKNSAINNSNSGVSFIVVKITAICPHHILKRVSDLLRWEYHDNSMKLPWKLNSLPILCDSSPFYHTKVKPETLTPEEELDLHLAYERMFRICQKSVDANLPLLFDAEETLIQPAIDYFAYSAAVKYGSGSEHNPRSLIFNTIQAYLKDSSERLKLSVEAAEKMGINLGIKLVRGAYMNHEKAEAKKNECATPIHDSIEDTHNCYNHLTEYLLQKIAKGSASAVIATHNIQSGKMAVVNAFNLGIDRTSHRLNFAQLYGMADVLSFGLKNEGYNVSKYLPFGPVEKVMPYLMRRAEENKSLLGASSIDISLMRSEVLRRLTSPGS